MSRNAFLFRAIFIILVQILAANCDKKIMQNGIAVNGGRMSSYQNAKNLIPGDRKANLNLLPNYTRRKSELLEDALKGEIQTVMLSKHNFPKEHNYRFDPRKYLKVDRVGKRINTRINTDATVNGGYKDMFEPLTYSVTRRRRSSGAYSSNLKNYTTPFSNEVQFEARFDKIFKEKSSTMTEFTKNNKNSQRNIIKSSSEFVKTRRNGDDVPENDQLSFADIVEDTDLLLNNSSIEDYDVKNNITNEVSNDIPKKTRSLFSDLIEIPRSKDITIIKPSQIDVFGVVNSGKGVNVAKAKAAVTLHKPNRTKLSEEYEDEKHLTISDALKLTDNPPADMFENKLNKSIDSVVPLNETEELKKIEDEERQLVSNNAPVKVYNQEKYPLPYNQTDVNSTTRLTEKSLIRILSVLLTTFKKIILQHQRMKKMHRDVMIASKDVMTKRLEVLNKLNDFDKRHKMLIKQGSQLAALQNIFSGKQEIFLRKEKEFFEKRNEFQILKNKFLEQQMQFFKLKEDIEKVMNSTKFGNNQSNATLKDGARKISRITQLISKGNEILDHNLQTLRTYNSTFIKKINKTDRIRWSEKLYDLRYINNLLLEKDYNDIDQLVHKYYFKNTTIDRILKNLSNCNCQENNKSTSTVDQSQLTNANILIEINPFEKNNSEKNEQLNGHENINNLRELHRHKRRADDDRDYKSNQDEPSNPVEISFTEINNLATTHVTDLPIRKSKIEEEHSNLSVNRESDESSYSYVAEKREKNDDQSEETFKFILKKNKNKPRKNFREGIRYSFLSQMQPKMPNHYLTTDRIPNDLKEDTYNLKNNQEKEQNRQLKTESYSHSSNYDENNDHRFSEKDISLREDKQIKLLINQKMPSEPSPFQPEEPLIEQFKSSSNRNERIDDSRYRYLTNINADSTKDDFSRETYNKVPIENSSDKHKDTEDNHKILANEEQHELPIEIHSREKIDDTFSKELVHKTGRIEDGHDSHYTEPVVHKDEYTVSQYNMHSKENDSGRKHYEEKNEKNIPQLQTGSSRETHATENESGNIKKDAQVTKENSAEFHERHPFHKNHTPFYDSSDQFNNLSQKDVITKPVHTRTQEPSLYQKYHGLTIDSSEMYNTYPRKESELPKDIQVENREPRHSSESKHDHSRDHYKNYFEDENVKFTKKYLHNERDTTGKKYFEDERIKSPKSYVEDERVKSLKNYIDEERSEHSKKYSEDERIKLLKTYADEERIKSSKNHVEDEKLKRERVKPSKIYLEDEREKPLRNYLDDERVKSSNTYSKQERKKLPKIYSDIERVKSSNPFSEDEKTKPTKSYLDDERVQPKNYLEDERVQPSRTYVDDETGKHSKHYLEEERIKQSKTYIEDERVKPLRTYLEDDREKPSKNYVVEERMKSSDSYLEDERLKSPKTHELNSNYPRTEIRDEFISKENVRTVTEKNVIVNSTPHTKIHMVDEHEDNKNNIRVSANKESLNTNHDNKEEHRRRHASKSNHGIFENNSDQIKTYESDHYPVERKSDANNHDRLPLEMNSVEKFNSFIDKDKGISNDNTENSRYIHLPEIKQEVQNDNENHKEISSTPFTLKNSEERKAESRYTYYSENLPEASKGKRVIGINRAFKTQYLNQDSHYTNSDKLEPNLELIKNKKEDQLQENMENVIKNEEKHKEVDKRKEETNLDEAVVDTSNLKTELKQNLTKSIKSARKLSKILEHSILHSLLKARKYVAEASAENVENVGETIKIIREDGKTTTKSPKLMTTTTSEKPDSLNIYEDEPLLHPSKTQNDDPFNLQSVSSEPSIKKKKSDKATDVAFAKMVKKFLKKVKRKLNITI